MIKNKIKLESIVKDRVGHFVLDNDCPIDIVKDMIFQFQKYVEHVEAAALAMQESEKQNSEEKKSEEVKSDV